MKRLLLSIGHNQQSSTQAIIFLWNFMIFFFPDIKHTWSLQHLYGLPILSQDGTLFKHPREMSDFSNLCGGKGCPLSLMEERAKAGPQEEGEWPQPKPWGSRLPLEYLMPLGREVIYLRFLSLKAKLNVPIIHIHSRKIRKYRKAEKKNENHP